MAKASIRFLDLISKRRGGLIFDVARATLLVLSVPYMLAVMLRNAWYGAIRGTARRVGRPVISIGNITVGGTGKTPMAAYVANRLAAQSRNVAILLRGYKGKRIRFQARASDRALRAWQIESDEAMVLKRLCPRTSVLIEPNRVAGARRAVASGADVIVLDDGFQHRRLARDLDIVLIDATEPFGYGHMLPRGLLREPARSLRRADLVVLTRSDHVDASTRSLLAANLRRVSGGKPVAFATHASAGFVDVRGEPVPEADPTAMRAVIFAGIANFGSFQRSVEQLGVQVLAAYQYPDHHAYSDEEIAEFPNVATTLDANVLLTTEKDAVKLAGRWRDETLRLLVLRAAISFDDDSRRAVDSAIDGVLGAP